MVSTEADELVEVGIDYCAATILPRQHIPVTVGLSGVTSPQFHLGERIAGDEMIVVVAISGFLNRAT